MCEADLIVFGFHRNSNLKDSNGIKCAYVVWSCWFDWSVSNVCAVTGESYTGFVLAVTVCCCISSRLGWLYLFGMINKSSLAELGLSFVSPHFQIWWWYFWRWFPWQTNSGSWDITAQWKWLPLCVFNLQSGVGSPGFSSVCYQFELHAICRGTRMKCAETLSRNKNEMRKFWRDEIQSNRIKSCRKVGGVWKWSNQKLLV